MPGATPFAMIRRIFSGVVLVVLVLTLALILKKAPAPPVATSRTAAAAAEQKFDAADREAAAGQPAHVQLDSAELNSYLAQNLELAGASDAGDAPGGSASAANSHPASHSATMRGTDPQVAPRAATSVKSVQVDLDGDVVKTYVVFRFHGADLSLELDGHLYTHDGYLKFDPLDGKLGSFPLPQSALASAVQKMMDSPENHDKLKLPDDVSDIEVQNGQFVVSYK